MSRYHSRFALAPAWRCSSIPETAGIGDDVGDVSYIDGPASRGDWRSWLNHPAHFSATGWSPQRRPTGTPPTSEALV